MKNKYQFGRRGEEAIAARLRSKGASVKLSPGSRGAADMHATFKNTAWAIQAKTSSTSTPGRVGKTELTRLKISASRRGATPVIATKTTKGMAFTSAKTGRKLRVPKGT